MKTKSEVKERSIRLTGHEVRAILGDRKTQTRRVIDCLKGFPKIRQFGRSDTPGYDWHFRCKRGLWHAMRESQVLELCPYGKPWDRLWVRETWCLKHDGDGFVYNKDGNRDSSCVWYRADGTEVVSVDGDGFSQWNKDGTAKSPWSRSIHMPRWASRITLEITDVRVQRLNDVSEKDAIAEGCFEFASSGLFGHDKKGTPCTMVGASAVEAYYHLWESINGEGSWTVNPWVWVVEFKKVDA